MVYAIWIWERLYMDKRIRNAGKTKPEAKRKQKSTGMAE